MKRSAKGKTVYAEIGVWREAGGSIHFTIKGLENGHVAVNSDPVKRNGHPTLFAKLEQVLAQAPKGPEEIQVQFVSPDGRSTPGPTIKLR